MPKKTPADNVPQYIAVIVDANRGVGGASATDLTGLIDLPAIREAHQPSC